MAELDDFMNQAAAPKPKGTVYLRKKARLNAKNKEDDREKELAVELIRRTNKELPSKEVAMRSRGVIERAYNNFETAVGGRQALSDTLNHAPEVVEGLKKIQKLLNDPDFGVPNKYPLLTLCQRHHVPLGMVVQAFRDASIARLSAEAIAQLSEHAPTIVSQIALDAQNTKRTCFVCDGTTRIPKIGPDGELVKNEDGTPVTANCYKCHGAGEIYMKADGRSREQFLKITGILDEKKGINIQTNLNQQVGIVGTNFTPGDGTFEKIIKAIDAVKHDESAIDVEVIPHSVYDEAKPPLESSTDPA